MTKRTNNLPAQRRSHIETVNAHDLHVNPVAQRAFRPAWAAQIAAEWDIDKYQRPHVNRRDDGSLYIMEGQHGTHAYRVVYRQEGVDTLPVQVELYEGLTEQEEAEFFLSLNNKKAIDAMSRFKVAVTAGYSTETDIDRIVRANGAVVTASTDTAGAISAVNALRSIYSSHGGHTLGATIRALRDSFGDQGYERHILLGLAAVIARYGVTEESIVASLAKVPRGSKGLSQAAALNREAFGCTIVEATSAAIVDAYNKGRRGKAKLPSWWHVADEADAA